MRVTSRNVPGRVRRALGPRGVAPNGARVALVTLIAFSLNAGSSGHGIAHAAPGAKDAASGAASNEIITIPPIPRNPTAPPSLAQPAPVNPFSCQRTFVFQGEALGCDSNVQQDAERLRPIIQGVPAAVEELNMYQRNRRTMSQSAYITTLGVGVMLAGFLLSRPAFEQSTITTGGYLVLGGAAAAITGVAYRYGAAQASGGSLLQDSTSLAYIGAISLGLALAGFATDHPPFRGGVRPGGYFVLGGLGLGVAGFGFALGIRRANEFHLGRAVEAYNQARPDKPIELQFSTEINF